MAEVININQLTELARLKTIKGYAELAGLFENGGLIVRDKKVANEQLYLFLEVNQVEAALLEKKDGFFLVDKYLVQLILIDLLLVSELKSYDIIEVAEKVREISDQQKPLLYWNDSGLVIAYLHAFSLKKWTEFVSEAVMDWKNFNALIKAMSLIRLDADELILFFHKLLSTEDFTSGTHQVSQILTEKLKVDSVLADDFEGRLEQLIGDDSLRRFASTIIIGLTGNDSARFEKLLVRFKDLYSDNLLFEVLWGFVRCCPEEKRSELEFLLYEKFSTGKLSKSQYLQLSGLFKSVSNNITGLLVQPLAADDFLGVYEYLFDMADSHAGADWYRLAALSIYSSRDKDHVYRLDSLLYHISGRELGLVYELLTLRFEALGGDLFLKTHLDHIIDLNRDLFKLNLTKWLNSENRNTHRALLSICSGRDRKDIAMVSDGYFRALPEKEKVYICFKIAGFVYSMEHLQSLLFSVLDASSADDEVLLVNLYSIFSDYLVYNYRSTLDMIKERLADEKIPDHHSRFLQPIVDGFESYFAQLNTVRIYDELRGDSKLEEFIRFYKSQLFATSMEKENKGGLLSMFTSVTVHAKKWAIRREEEKVHLAMPLDLIQHSIEFPSGEKLNPTYHESLRRTYQKIQKHEINFS